MHRTLQYGIRRDMKDYKCVYGYYTNWEDIDEDADVRPPQCSGYIHNS